MNRSAQVAFFALLSLSLGDAYAKKRKSSSSSSASASSKKKVSASLKTSSADSASDAPDSQSKWTLGVGLGLHGESSNLSASQSIDAVNFDEGFEYKSGPLMGRLWVWKKWKKKLLWGGGLRYHGNYGAEREDEDEFIFGQLIDVYASARFFTPVRDKIDVLIEGNLGAMVLIPGGNFSQEIDRMKAEGVGVWGGPRVGVIGGVAAGSRYRFTPKISGTAKLNVDMGRLFLFRNKETVSGLDVEKSWTSEVVRTSLTLGVEIAI